MSLFAELRRRNLIGPDQMPYDTGFQFTYDSGNYPVSQTKAEEAAGWANFEERRLESLRRGKLRGIGMGHIVEIAAGMNDEMGAIDVEADGSVTISTGFHNHGQGQETTMRQLVSEFLGVPPDRIKYRDSDTDVQPFGFGSAGSRAAAVGGALFKAISEKIIEKGKVIAAIMLDTSAEEIDFNRYTLLNLHALLSNNLLADPSASGRLRYVAVGIDQSVFHPLEVPQLIEESFDQLLQKASAIEDPFEQAFFVMVHLPYLQPFDDVNKRVSRLAANIPLIRKNLAPLSFTDVSQRAYTDAILGVYELNDHSLLRDVFFWAYERSAARYAAVRQSLGEPDPFRLKYRAEVREIVAMLIREKVGRKQVGTEVSAWASSRVEPEDRDRFTEIVEDELIGMHEGNFARYQVRPSEFRAWQDVWGSK